MPNRQAQRVGKRCQAERGVLAVASDELVGGRAEPRVQRGAVGGELQLGEGEVAQQRCAVSRVVRAHLAGPQLLEVGQRRDVVDRHDGDQGLPGLTGTRLGEHAAQSFHLVAVERLRRLAVVVPERRPGGPG